LECEENPGKMEKEENAQTKEEEREKKS